jgi:hypothetical protein
MEISRAFHAILIKLSLNCNETVPGRLRNGRTHGYTALRLGYVVGA